MAKGKHGDYERIELPEWFSPSGKKMWILVYKDKPCIRVAGYDVDMWVTQVQSRRPTDAAHGGAHVMIEVSEQPGAGHWEDEPAA